MGKIDRGVRDVANSLGRKLRRSPCNEACAAMEKAPARQGQ